MCSNHPQIAVLITGSARDHSALRTASWLARGRQPAGTVVLLRVIPPAAQLRIGDGAPLVDLAEREADRQLRTWAARLSSLRVQRVVLVGDEPAKEVGRWLAEHPVDAVVVAKAERHRWRRPGHDVGQALLRQATVPVVIAPAGAHERAEAGLDPRGVLAEAERILRGA